MKLYEHGEKLPDRTYLVCPVCGFEYVHPMGIKVNAGGDITTVTSKGTARSKGEASDRGVRIDTVYFCEGGHQWTLSQQFHKGSVFLDVIEHEKWTVDPAGANIWRD